MREPPPHLSIGPSDFAKLREPGVLFADKSDLIRRVLADTYETVLFPRPRRFGKSTNLSMLGYFLGKSDKDHSALFQDLSIWRSPEARPHFQEEDVVKLDEKIAALRAMARAQGYSITKSNCST